MSSGDFRDCLSMAYLLVPEKGCQHWSETDINEGTDEDKKKLNRNKLALVSNCTPQSSGKQVS